MDGSRWRIRTPVSGILSNRSVGAAILKHLFPHVNEDIYAVFLTDDEKEFNTVVSAYFPIRL